MLQHEQTDPPTVSPTVPLPVPNAADARVTPDELNAALKALEDRQSSTVAIGSVVDELRLNATPEQIWEQVQQQRAQQAKAEQDERQSKVTVRVMVNGQAVAQSSAAARRRMRTWRDIKGWAWVLFWCTGGLGLLSGLPHLLAPSGGAAQTITVNGDNVTQTINGYGKHIVVNGDGDKIILHGPALSMTINGDYDTIAGDTARSLQTNGDNDTVTWTGSPEGGTTNRGHGNHITVTAP